MSETGDFNPGPWKGHDFKSARKKYDVHVDRSYGDAVDKSVDASSLVPDTVTTKSESPLVIALDVTGSMGAWPATIFSKLPYLDIEGKEYLGDDMEISFAAIGDMFSDKYPLQVRPFVGGTDLKKELEGLIIEKGGGGSSQESYDLAALYYSHNCDMPNAIKPIFIFVGDEGLYDFVDKDGGENHAKVNLKKRLAVETLFEELKSKFAVYLVHKVYQDTGDNSLSESEKRIQKQWENLIGADHICPLPAADRVVDVIFGILARETGKVDYFTKEINDRQTKAQVNAVMKSLRTVHAGGAAPTAVGGKGVKKTVIAPEGGRSITRRKKSGDSKKTNSLI